ncbi:hypothetical protein D3C79_878860 [compost metagenome]
MAFQRVGVPLLDGLPVTPGHLGAAQFIVHAVPAVLAKAVKGPMQAGLIKACQHVLKVLSTSRQAPHAAKLPRHQAAGRHLVSLRPLLGAFQILLNPLTTPHLLLPGKLHGTWIGIRFCPVQVWRAGSVVRLVHVKTVQHASVRQRGRPVGKGIGGGIPASVDHHRR